MTFMSLQKRKEGRKRKGGRGMEEEKLRNFTVLLEKNKTNPKEILLNNQQSGMLVINVHIIYTLTFRKNVV